MKKIRIFALLLASAMSAGLASGCGSGSGDVKDTSSSTSGADTSAVETGPEFPDYKLDLGGESFTILYFDAVSACGWSSDIPCDVDVEEQTGDMLSDAVFTRNRKIEEMYNLKIEAVQDKWEVYSTLERSVMSASGEYDAAFVKQQGLSSPIANGYLTKLDDLLDFDMPWWDKKSLEGFGVNGMTYAIAGDVTFVDKLCDIVVFFNKNMAEDYQLGDIYKLVVDGGWTFDKMLAMCQQISADLNDNGAADKDDCFGFSGQNDAAYELFQSAGERFCTLDKDGIPYLSNDSDRAVSIMMKIYEFMADSKNFFNRQTANLTVADTINMFKSNRVLFLMRPLQTLMELRAMDADFGIIPTPKMDDTQQDYHTSIGFTVANCVTIPVDAKSIETSAKVLDTLAADSYFNLNSVFYDTVLGAKLTRDDNSTENLDIILNSCVFDPGCIFEFGKMVNTFMTPNDPGTVSSTIASLRDAVKSDIDTFVEVLNNR